MQQGSSSPPQRGNLDTVLRAQTPEGIEYTLHPAGIPIRFCAAAIDGFIQGLVFIALTSTLGLLANGIGMWLSMLLNFILTWFYHVLFELLNGGRSPGKAILALRVVRSDGSPIDPGASFLRNVLRFADSFMSLSLVAFLSMAISPGFRRLGDWAADTLVVYTSTSEGQVRLPSSPGALGPTPPPRPLSYEEKQALLMFARRFPVLGRARADELAAPYARQLLGGEPPDGRSPSDYLRSIALGTIGSAI